MIAAEPTGTLPAFAYPPAGAPTRVLVVDDHRAFADSIAIALGFEDDLICVGTVASIAEGIEAIERERPDVVLLDVRLPDGDGIAAIERLLAHSTGSRVIVLTGFTDAEVMARAASAGVCGFLPKESPVSAVVRVIRAARDGDFMVEGSTIAAILGRLISADRAPSRPSDGAPAMTARELEVLALMGQGLDPHSIAALLRISIHTCRGYQKRILTKLDAHSQLEAVVRASRHGLIGVAD